VAGTALSEAQPYISQAAANGTAVAAYAVTEPLGSADAKGVIWETSTAKQFGIFGKIIAAQVVTAASTAGNSKPQALFLNIPDISINDQATTQFQSNFKKWCTGCKQYTLNLGLSTISSAPSQIISFLRAHPGVKYIASTNDGSFVGLTSALKSAGITGVSYFGAAPVTANLQQIKNGQQAGTVALGQWEGMYGAVDAIIRHTVGDAQVPGNTGSAPAWIITTKNLAQTDFGTSSYPSSGLVPLDAAIADHYLSLWGKSSS
jgi:ABC-type sugar transport system substrate-binding protein